MWVPSPQGMLSKVWQHAITAWRRCQRHEWTNETGKPAGSPWTAQVKTKTQRFVHTNALHMVLAVGCRGWIKRIWIAVSGLTTGSYHWLRLSNYPHVDACTRSGSCCPRCFVDDQHSDVRWTLISISESGTANGPEVDGSGQACTPMASPFYGAGAKNTICTQLLFTCGRNWQMKVNVSSTRRHPLLFMIPDLRTCNTHEVLIPRYVVDGPHDEYQ